MTSEPNPHTLDAILALQLAVAQLGEVERLGWWQSDLIDPDAGGYLFETLLPRTGAWAALEAARAAAVAVDRAERHKLANPDTLRTLFFWGYELNERLRERLLTLKHSNASPDDALLWPIDRTQRDRDAIQASLQRLAAGVEHDNAAARRALLTPAPDAVRDQAHALAAALAPLGESYPTPYFRVEGAA